MRTRSTVAPRKTVRRHAPKVADPIEAFVIKHSTALCNLAARWQDECEYEDIADYADVMKKLLPRNWRFVEVHTAPLGFKFAMVGAAPIYKLNVEVDSVEKDWIEVFHESTKYRLLYYPEGQ